MTAQHTTAMSDARQRFGTMLGGHAPTSAGRDAWARTPQPGDVLDGGLYRLLAPIGAGGTARVFRGERVADGRIVAVKLLTIDPLMPAELRAEASRRFEQEALAISGLDHPHIVEVVDFGYTHGHRPFLVLEYLDGRSLADRLDAGERFEPARVARILHQVCQALEHAHGRQVVHRDLKPDNIILIRGADGSDCVKVVDFGIARVRDPRIGRKLTGQHQLLGTPPYMSPEHLDAAKAGPASDLYSLGIVAWELLTGEVPFDSDDPLETMLMHLHEAPPKLLVPDADRGTQRAWRELIDRLLEKRPEDRPSCAAHVGEVLAELSIAAAPRSAVRKRIRTGRFHTAQTMMVQSTPEMLRQASRRGLRERCSSAIRAVGAALNLRWAAE